MDLAAMAGLELDDWQQLSLEVALARRPDRRWAARTVGETVSRQNGKGGILEARELGGLFLFDERKLIHSAHLFATSREAFMRMRGFIESTPQLHRRVKPRGITTGNGNEAIELKTGARLEYKARTGGGGRGLSGDLVVLDEAMYLPDMVLGALMPVMSARPNPQMWVTGSAVDQTIHPDGKAFARIRRDAITGADPSLAYLEWSPDATLAEARDLLDDEEVWAQANPAYGIRISRDSVLAERRRMGAREFAVERLCIGDWPNLDEDDSEYVIDPDLWEALTDERSRPLDPLHVAVDATPYASHACVAIAGRRADGLSHFEVIEHEAGTGWVVELVARVVANHGIRNPVLVDEKSPAAALIPALKGAGVRVRPTGPADMVRACGVLMNAVCERTVRHLGTPELAEAIRGAAKRMVGDSGAWAWTRTSSTVDISPLVAVTLALWAVGEQAAAPRRSSFFEVVT